ncbi:MAG TPA: serine/threonine-protein kinase [Polyangiales bacterium]|nr:serine/threonine-protein kinase [Polyangiales bacterium]
MGVKQSDPLIGSTLAGRYRIEARVGAGAMGAVYRASQAGLGRAVALKVLKRDMAWGGDTVQRFRREAKAMSALNHPNTVRVFDFGATDDGLLFLAMEMLDGEPATEHLARTGAIGMADAVIFAQGVLRSIGEAHSKGIVHRDLKPDNIFLTKVEGHTRPMVKVLDFGIAKAIEGERKIDQFETLDGTVFGTPRYMSPEQAAGKPLDPRSDLYSVGILLYEFLTGHPPFEDADAVVVMAKHIRETPLPLRRSAPPDRVIPESLEAVVSRALEKDPAMRWQSAEEFDAALARCLTDVTRYERLSLAGAHKTPVGRLMMASARTRTLIAAFTVMVVCGIALASWLSARDVHLASNAQSVAQAEGAGPALAAATETGAGNGVPAVDPQPIAPPGAPAQPAVITLKTEPAGAEVSRDGTQLGVTPLEIVVPQGQLASVSLHKPGFVDHTVELHSNDRERVIELNPLPAPPRAPREPKVAARPHRTRSKPTRTASRTGTATKAPGTDSTSPYEKF